LETDKEEAIRRVYDRIADVLMVLSDVALGDYSNRLTTEHAEDDPLGALAIGLNEMIDALATARRRSAEYQRELEEKLTTIERQRVAIRELSTPIMEVWAGILCLPIVGIMDSARSADTTDALLRAVVATRARCAIIDITGIEVMDTRTADHFIRMTKSVRLLGAECVLTGINPQIAQTIVQMGIDMQGVVTYRSLRDALGYFVRAQRVGQERAASSRAAQAALK
jgi:rsbT co-antagonist protein RsbR